METMIEYFLLLPFRHIKAIMLNEMRMRSNSQNHEKKMEAAEGDAEKGKVVAADGVVPEEDPEALSLALARQIEEEELRDVVAQIEAAEAAERVVASSEAPPRGRRQPDPEGMDPEVAEGQSVASLLSSVSDAIREERRTGRRAPARASFDRKYQGYSRMVSGVVVDADSFEHGDKILLPPSALQELSGRNLLSSSVDGSTPTLFRISVRRFQANAVFLFGGVLEFSAPHACMVLPTWMMATLGLEDGDAVSVQKAELPAATYCKLRPVNFMEFKMLENHRAVLEATLRGYFTLTKGTTISVLFQNHEYIFEIVDTAPGDAVCILNADVETEFDLPDDYFIPMNQEVNNSEPLEENEKEKAEEKSIFGGGAEGKALNMSLDETDSTPCDSCGRRVPTLSYERHKAFCERNIFVCPDCGTRVPLTQKESHSQLHAPVECACGDVCPADMLDTHSQFVCSLRQVEVSKATKTGFFFNSCSFSCLPSSFSVTFVSCLFPLLKLQNTCCLAVLALKSVAAAPSTSCASICSVMKTRSVLSFAPLAQRKETFLKRAKSSRALFAGFLLTRWTTWQCTRLLCMTMTTNENFFAL